jgi:heme-degrading monooxygenase HmoA
MQKVLIDTFIVPDESKSTFRDAVRELAGLIRTLPGFVEGFIHEKTDGKGPYNVVTTAVWENEEAFKNAKRLAGEEFQKRVFNRQEIMKRLQIKLERAVYDRSSY